MAIIGDGGLSALIPNNVANQQQVPPRESAANGGAAGRSADRGGDIVLDLSPEARAVVRPGADAVGTAPSAAGAGERETAAVERRAAADQAEEAAVDRRADDDAARRESRGVDIRV